MIELLRQQHERNYHDRDNRDEPREIGQNAPPLWPVDHGGRPRLFSSSRRLIASIDAM